ncbi:response regulator transcription factor [Mangrovicoccus sp. HB161399]|uniref:response regulator n=1 Tax=Mangrovicoccus sp. HB161399 TaxID=2720392 RepID=UPI0015547ED9|nr:response regulator transcription factor [Mangrovicoccus sp. HB161399]
MARTPPFSAILADDHQIVRLGLRSQLDADPEFEVAAEVADGLQAIVETRRHRPDLLLLDVQMPLAGGVEVIVEVRRWSPETKIVVLTGIASPGLVANIVEAGVEGLFSKREDLAPLFDALPLIMRGGRKVAPFFLDLLGQGEETAGLTMRERQTLNMILAGRSNREIAAGFGISVKTVEKHRTSLMQKLGVNSIAQLLAVALRDGLIDPSQEL